MANAAVISRTNLIYGVCLPLAVLIGYLLAEPFEVSSLAVLFIVVGILCIPLLMRWHHPLLIFSCNAAIFPYFLPGKLTIWMLMSAMSFSILVLNRTLGWDVRFFKARNLSQSLIFITIVVVVTACLDGGIGFKAFGSSSFGGKRYLEILLAITAYFSISTIAIPRRWAMWAVGAYFLSALTGLVGYLAAWGGPSLYFLAELFPVQGAVTELSSGGFDPTASQFTRYGGLLGIGSGILSFMLARYGMRGLLDLSRPWRLCFFVLSLGFCLLSGFRSVLINLTLVCALLFYMEGLFRTRIFPALLLSGTLCMVAILPFTTRLPLPVQRSIAFLPVNVDPIARDNAEGSSDWRIQMWREVLPTVPQYLIKGKGYNLNPSELALVEEAEQFGTAPQYEVALIAGDYHSGPLSLIVPLGLFGVAGFFWFLWASWQVFRKNYLFGDPALKGINNFLLASFIVRVIAFFFIFGSFYSDLIYFTSLVALSVSLNGGVCERPEPVLPEYEDEMLVLN